MRRLDLAQIHLHDHLFQVVAVVRRPAVLVGARPQQGARRRAPLKPDPHLLFKWRVRQPVGQIRPER